KSASRRSPTSCYDSSVQLTNRTAAEDCEIAGTPVRQWETVTLVLGAANHDPKQFDNPGCVDVTRADIRHVGFGLGPHFCLGAAPTRLETTVALRTLVRRFPRMEVSVPALTYSELVGALRHASASGSSSNGCIECSSFGSVARHRAPT